MNRTYTDAHPNEPCDPCKYCIIQHAKCTYKSTKYWCVRDEQAAQENANDGLLLNFDE